MDTDRSCPASGKSCDLPRCPLDVVITAIHGRPMQGRLDYITKHFLVLSAAATIFGATISIVFIAGYLAAFDRSSIWIIEYTDLIKFSLIGISIFSASAGFISSFAQDAVIIITSNSVAKRISIAIAVAGIFLVFGIPAYYHYKSGDTDGLWREVFHIIVALLFIIIILVISEIMKNFKEKQDISFHMIITFITLIIIFLSGLGLSYGFRVRADMRSFHDIVTKDRSNFEQTYKRSKLIMILSHHTIFELDGKVNIIQSADITRISSSK